MKFFKAIQAGFKSYINIQDAASRSDFWLWLLFVCIFLCFALVIDGAYLGPWLAGLSGQEVMAFDQDTPKWFSGISLIVLIIPTITFGMRRIIDAGFSKWWIVLIFTVIGILPLLYFFVKKRQK